jgi:glycosyltransferase involved in cell wall biosynthesis
VKIIVAIPYAPWPITRGTDRLILNLLDGLSANHDVVLVTMALSRPELERLREIEKPRIGVRAMLAPNKRSRAHRAWYKGKNLARAVLAGVPPQVSYAAPAQLLRLIADTAREERADLVLASYWHLYRLPELITGRKLALITHDLDFVVNAGRVGAARGLGRVAAALGARMLERVERAAYARYDTILTVTPSDAEVLRRHPLGEGKAIYSLPLAMDLSDFAPGAYGREKGTVLFLGMFHADFNRDALRFLLRDVFPRVRAEKPEARLEIVGHGVNNAMRASAGGGVHFAGGVDDIRPYLGRCSVMVLPLRFGGGVRIRMMEAAAMGTPVVSTPVGVGGMGLTAGVEYIEVQSAADMAEGVVRLLENEAEARSLGANARRWAERTMSMHSYPARLEELLGRIAPAF